ncbi:MAG TPA: carboxypeptidase-like regulatory domain-containing protein [Vicinamibacterales bacterium]|nr:carboxypeptidase-like regulatory domain-containing protein [Vicinamibacterales bacterium]
MNPKTVQLTVAFVAFANIVWSQTPTRTVDVSKGDTPRSVTLSLAEYNRLIDLAGRPQPDARVAPIGAVVTNADLKIRVDRDAAHGVFALTGDVLRGGVNRVPLVSGATLMEGTTQGRTLPLAADNGVQSALIPGPGPFALTLEWGATVTLSPGRASFLLPVPLASTARATLDVPGDQADVRVSNGVVTRRTSADGRTTVEVTLRPAATTEVSWSMRDSAPVVATRELRYLADVFSLVTIGDSDVRLATLVDVSILAGELRSIPVRIPDGYEVTGVSGSSIESSEPRNGGVLLTMGDMAARRHQFLITMERPHTDGSFALDTGFPSLPEAQRERGEIAVEGTGTLELNAPQEAAAALLHRIDVRELNAALQSLSRTPLLVAFRYQRTPSAPAATLAMDVKRFGDAGVVAAIAERAAATTLVTTEGRALTEVRLTMQNRAQPFLKVALPQGATMVSVDVAGQPAKPVVGADGTRVPLLRPGFRPNGSYQVSFVYLYAGKPFAKKGDFQLTLPKIDVPIAIADWEVFVPEQFSVRAFDGNVIERSLTPVYSPVSAPAPRYHVADRMHVSDSRDEADVAGLPGQIRGRVIDPTGEVLPGVAVRFEAGPSSQVVSTGADGSYVLSNVPSGNVQISAFLAGFVTARQSLFYTQQPRRVDFVLGVASVAESITVAGESPRVERDKDVEKKPAFEPPSQNVINLQQRTAGVLPIRVDIPRAGTSHQFVKPLIVDQETTVSLRYKRR